MGKNRDILQGYGRKNRDFLAMMGKNRDFWRMGKTLIFWKEGEKNRDFSEISWNK